MPGLVEDGAAAAGTSRHEILRAHRELIRRYPGDAAASNLGARAADETTLEDARRRAAWSAATAAPPGFVDTSDAALRALSDDQIITVRMRATPA